MMTCTHIDPVCRDEGYLPMHYPEATNLEHGTALLYEASHDFSSSIANHRGQPISGCHADYQARPEPLLPVLLTIRLQAFIPCFNPSKPYSKRMGVPLVQRIPSVPGQGTTLLIDASMDLPSLVFFAASPLPMVPTDLESCLMFQPIDHTGTTYASRSLSPGRSGPQPGTQTRVFSSRQ